MRVRHNLLKEKEVNKEKSTSEKRDKNLGFFKDISESFKSTARIIAMAGAATVLAVSCGNSKKSVGDVDDTEVSDIQEDDAREDVPDIPDVLEEDILEDEEHETICLEGDVLEGEVPPIIAKTEEEVVEFNGPVDQSVSGNSETTVGGDVSGESLLVLGECPDEPESIAAFGAQNTSVEITPSWRIDIMGANAELSDVDDDVCPPPSDSVPISMFNTDTNTTVIPAVLGSEDGRAQVGFANLLTAAIFIGDSDLTEVTSPFLLTEGDYSIKTVAVMSAESILNLDTAVYSDTGSELVRNTLSTLLGPKSSKKLKISQLDSDDSMLPNIGDWQATGTPGRHGSIYLCLRPCQPDPASTVVELSAEVEGIDVTGVIDDTCGKIFAAFDIVSVSAEFDTTIFTYGVEPLHLADDYTLSSSMHYGEGLDAMSEDSPSVHIYIKRESTTVLDSGDLVIMDIRVNAELETRDNKPAENPLDSAPETAETSFIFRVSVPSLGDYSDVCGCDPSLP